MNNFNSINNDGVPYYFPADIAKEGNQCVRISNFFKTRVGDNGKVLPFKWYDQGRVMNVHGFIPFIKGLIGKFSTDDNEEVIMAPDASYREWQGSTANAHDGGFMDYILENQMFSQEGIFKGHFGLKDGNGNVLTSVNIIFEVLGNDLRVGETVKYYVSELENLKNKYKVGGEQIVKDFNAKIEAGTETDRQALDALRASIQANRDGQAAIKLQIDSQNIVTLDKYNDLVNAHKDVRNHTDFRYPTDQSLNTAINLNSDPYLDTGIYKIGNCSITNGPWADVDTRRSLFLQVAKYDDNLIYQTINHSNGELYTRCVSKATNSYPGWARFATMEQVVKNISSVSGNLQAFITDQIGVNKRVDYGNPSEVVSNQMADLNNYRETGILKIVNCLIQNGPYKSDNRHTIFLKTTNLDGQTQYQTVYEGDNLYGRKLFNGIGKWYKYTNTQI
ncbi:hypothetical protein [Lactobacillus gasseri]